MSSNAVELIAHVSKSPEAVGRHDRATWVGLFARNGQINDPVGSSPHEGHEAIQRFYDTFIAPNTIQFGVEHDVVCGKSVFRDLTIQITMATGVVLQVPMHLRYDLVNEGTQLKIRTLYAHWELPGMILQLLKKGTKGIMTSIMLGPNLIKHQGIGGVIGFMKGFLGVHAGGKKTVQGFLNALNTANAAAMERYLDPNAHLEMPPGVSRSFEEVTQGMRGISWGKMLASGRTVTVSVSLADGRRGIALFEFERGSKITTAQLFV
jgi:hypothetical protein